MSDPRTRFYLDKRNKRFLGVCSGIADYFNWDVTLVRIGVLASVFITSGTTLMVYLIAAWVADAKPLALYGESADEREFWTKVRIAPQRTVRDIRASFRESDRRLQDIEAYVTSSNSRLASEIDKLR